MRSANINLNKDRIDCIVSFVINRHKRNAERMIAMNLKPQKFNKEIFESIVDGEAISFVYPWIAEGLNNKQCEKVWKAVVAEIKYRKAMGSL